MLGPNSLRNCTTLCASATTTSIRPRSTRMRSRDLGGCGAHTMAHTPTQSRHARASAHTAYHHLSNRQEARHTHTRLVSSLKQHTSRTLHLALTACALCTLLSPAHTHLKISPHTNGQRSRSCSTHRRPNKHGDTHIHYSARASSASRAGFQPEAQPSVRPGVQRAARPAIPSHTFR